MARAAEDAGFEHYTLVDSPALPKPAHPIPVIIAGLDETLDLADLDQLELVAGQVAPQLG